MRKLRSVIIGAGMSGILAAVKLRERGEDFMIYEKGPGVGGTWRENRYPGLTCDVPSHCYTYSFAPNPDWSRFYADGREIERYFQTVFERYDLADCARFNAEVTCCEFDDADSQWHIETADGQRDVADVVIAATGVLHHPNIPDVPGLQSFEGPAFHSARWDEQVAIDGKRVGVIGNGSTGVQLVTALAARCAKVVHFQRSPQWIMPGATFEYTPAQREAFRNDPSLMDAIRNDETYQAALRRYTHGLLNTQSEALAETEAIVLKNLEDSIRDPVLREKLRPGYRAACKRMIVSWGYYDAVQSPAVAVERMGIDGVEPRGVRLRDGRLQELDVIVLATGFRTDQFIRPTCVTGRHGVRLDDVWRERPSAFLGVSIPEFPNLFMLNGPTSPITNISLFDVAERQWDYMTPLLELLRSGKAREVSAAAGAMADYDARRIAAAKTTVFAACTSWYLDPQGVPSIWPWAYETYIEAMRAPVLADYDIR